MLGRPTLIPARASLLGLLLLLAGCASKAPDTGPAALKIPTHTTQAELDDTTCGIEGFVLDEEALPIAGARVELQGTESKTRTDGQGKFGFSFLAPTTYQVLAAAIGFDSQTRSVACVAGQKNQNIQFLLVELPPILPGFVKYHPLPGRIGCAVGLVVQTTDFCQQGAPLVSGVKVPVSLNPNAKSYFVVVPETGHQITTALYELRWQPTGAATQAWLYLQFPSVNTNSVRHFCPDTEPASANSNSAIRGKTTMCVRFDAFNETTPVYDVAQPRRYEINVLPSQTFTVNTTSASLVDKSSRLLFDQPFDLRVTYFYNGAAAPEGYSKFE